MPTIEKAVIDAMITQARREAPLEACGYLAEENGVIREAYPMRNADASAEHFSFEPTEQFETVRRIRGTGRRPAAVYHSHPITPARPSEEDIRLAFDPSVCYVILSLAGPEPVIKAFRIRPGSVVEEELRIVENSVSTGS